MQIYFLSSWFSTPDNPTAGIFFREQFSHISQNLDWNSHLLACEVLYPHQIRPSIFYNKNRIEDINHSYKLSLLPINTEQRRNLITFNFLEKLNSVHKEIDHIICFSGLYASKAAFEMYKKYGIKYTIVEHSSTFLQANKKIEKELEIYYKNAHVVAAVSNALARELEFQFDIVCKTINNPVETKKTTKNCHVPGATKFINVSNFTANKNILEIVKAFENFVISSPDSKLDLIGDGPTRKEIKKYVNSKDLSKSVTFSGRLKHSAVLQRMLQSNIYVNGSFVETFGIAPLEALLSGLNLVTTPCGGVNDFMSDFDNAIMISGFSQFDILEGMVKASKIDPKSSFDQLVSARDKFSVQRYINNIQELVM